MPDEGSSIHVDGSGCNSELPRSSRAALPEVAPARAPARAAAAARLPPSTSLPDLSVHVTCSAEAGLAGVGQGLGRQRKSMQRLYGNKAANSLPSVASAPPAPLHWRPGVANAAKGRKQLDGALRPVQREG